VQFRHQDVALQVTIQTAGRRVSVVQIGQGAIRLFGRARINVCGVARLAGFFALRASLLRIPTAAAKRRAQLAPARLAVFRPGPGGGRCVGRPGGGLLHRFDFICHGVR
jgi:hypothetical protein